MFRHGVRSWYQNYPNNPYNDSMWNSIGGYAQLTQVGKKQMTEFGDFFDHHYAEELQFDPSRVKVRSTDYGRTINSCKALLHGMFNDSSSVEVKYTNRKIDNVDFIFNNLCNFAWRKILNFSKFFIDFTWFCSMPKI